MPALVAGIHVLDNAQKEDVDGRDKPGHDGAEETFASYGIFFTGFGSRLNSRAALAPRMLRLAVSFRNGRS